jgi:hypothetical protein
MKQFISSMGFKFFLLYIFLVYILQFLYFGIYKDVFKIFYHGTETSLFIVFLLIFVFVLLVILLDRLTPHIKQFYISGNIVKAMKIITFILVLIYFIASIYFYEHYTMSFRANVRLRNVPLIIKIFVLITPIIRLYVFFIFIKNLKNGKINKLDKFNLLIILIGSILSLNSSTMVIFILLIVLLLLKPSIFRKKFSSFYLLLYSVLVFITLSFVVFIGTANKGGFDYALDIFSSLDKLHDYIGVIFSRISSSFMSIMALLENASINNDIFRIDIIQSIANTINNRLMILFPFDSIDKHEVFLSINRINYLLLFKPWNDHAGATPGLIASSIYLPFFPLSISFIAMYSLLIIRAINSYFSHIKQNNLLVLLAVLYFCNGFFESPLSIFMLFLEPVNITLLIFLLGSIMVPTEYNVPRKKNQN